MGMLSLTFTKVKGRVCVFHVGEHTLYVRHAGKNNFKLHFDFPGVDIGRGEHLTIEEFENLINSYKEGESEQKINSNDNLGNSG